MQKTVLKEKLTESLQAVLPIVAIVLVLSFTVAPMSAMVLLAFLTGAVFLVAGMVLFNIGASQAMEPIGQHLGSDITKTKKLGIILPLGFLLGFMITISEPDLQVLANQVTSIPNRILIFAVGAGVGLFLTVALLRMLFKIKLRYMLIISYVIIFIIACFAPDSFIAVAFDSGGVTTGPMTVPFIMAFGVGISMIRSDSRANDDSFGLIALCSAGPVLAVLILSLIYNPEGAQYTGAFEIEAEDSVELSILFLKSIPSYLKEIAVSLLPITAFFAVFQVIRLKLARKPLGRILVGIFYTYTGLVIFLTGANVGFMLAGSSLGKTLAQLKYNFIIIPLGMLIGYFIVKAEPAVYVLMNQVETLTDGGIKGSMLQKSLSVSVSISVGLSMLRVLTGIPVMYLLVPGYLAAIVLSFFTPDIFVAIAFDSGGVASGPMTATFLLPLATGACIALGGNVITDAFGVVAMVAMTPLITIQILGIIYKSREKKRALGSKNTPKSRICDFGALDDFEIIEL